ncbi:MAG: DNA replication/repair protein RecF [Chloroflexi bacterium]|nr:DNA replication/repair protein RecF [Chloroflexota bacterium]
MAYLSRLSLTNFRNFVELELDLPLGVVVFAGDNAQGKTTLLEAAYLLAIARSFRAENEREVINFQAGANGGQALVRGIVQREGRRISVNIGYQSTVAVRPSGNGGSAGGEGLGYSVRKQIRVDRIKKTAAELVGTVGAVLFSADDVALIYGSPSDRRRYLDILISQADPAYIKALQRYQRVVQQRNQLLKLRREGRAQADELEFWDGELVREGSAITWRRQETMRRLSTFCAEHHDQLSQGGEDFRVEYRPSVTGGGSLEDTEERYRESLAAFQQRESATATTAVGPHRDDFKLIVNGLDMGTFASRGEARTLALTLRLAEASYLSAARGDEPVVLLDDVLSEMDPARRQRVLEKVGRYQQSLITTTDIALVRGHFGSAASYFRVEGGRVIALKN